MKISIVGTTGSGKSTLAYQLAKKQNLQFIELDELHFLPNWVPQPKEIFISKVKKELEVDNWVTAGNYSSIRHLIWEDCTHIIWLNYPFFFSFFRILKRTLQRAYSQEELYPGCRESWKISFFSKDSIIAWFFKTYRKRQKKYPKLLEEHSHKNIIILKSQKETDAFLRQFPH